MQIPFFLFFKTRVLQSHPELEFFSIIFAVPGPLMVENDFFHGTLSIVEVLQC